MSRDIVERLRCFGYGTTNPEVCKEAADTIELLRARVAGLEAAAAFLKHKAECLNMERVSQEAIIVTKDQRIAELEAKLTQLFAQGNVEQGDRT